MKYSRPRNNKGQGLSINTIILVALALVVLIALVAVLTGNLGRFTKTMADCEGTYGGDCVAPADLTADCPDASYNKEKKGLCFGTDGTTVDTSMTCCVKKYTD